MEKSELQKRVKEIRIKKGLSQEELAENTGLNIRTIQRIENGETVPRGDTLKRLAVTLQVSPDEIIDWKIQKDNNLMVILHLSQLGFLAFPLLGIIIPLAIWILKKDKIQDIDSVGKSILNFQITWAILIFLIYLIVSVSMFFHRGIWPFKLFTTGKIIVGMYMYNLVFIFTNAIRYYKTERVKYFPALRFLN